MRKILVVIDMQNDFIDGSLGTKEAQQIVPRVVEKMKEYDPWNIYLTRDTHYENYLDTQEGRNLPIEHCIEGTHGWQLNDAVAKAAEKATVIDKPTFGSNRLAGILMTERAQEALEIELVGLCTDICVVSNALLFKAAMIGVCAFSMTICSSSSNRLSLPLILARVYFFCRSVPT